ncbi:MAG: hypothetical protein P9M14_13640 [Candidatus Alcyoniella australis]|nr:hypothetical protein [Candidatus Alcyoniella australis]
MKTNLRKTVSWAIAIFFLLQWAVGASVLATLQRANEEQQYQTRIKSSIDRIEGHINTLEMEVQLGFNTINQMAETKIVLQHTEKLEIAQMPATIEVRDRYSTLNLDIMVLLDSEERALLYLCDQELLPWRNKPELFLPQSPTQVSDTQVRSSVLFPRRQKSNRGEIYVGKLFSSNQLRGFLDQDMEGMVWIEESTQPNVYTQRPADSSELAEVREGQITWMPALEYEKEGSLPRYYGGTLLLDKVNYFVAVQREDNDRQIFNRSLLLLLVCLGLMVPSIFIGRRWAGNLDIK